MVFGALASGGMLHVLDADEVVDPAAVARYVTGRAIDCVKVVPSYLLNPVLVDGTNWKPILIDSGYYTEAQVK